MKEKYYVYEISYTDSRFGDLRSTTEVARDSDEALDKAMEDYYFLRLVDMYKSHEATDYERKEYGD